MNHSETHPPHLMMIILPANRGAVACVNPACAGRADDDRQGPREPDMVADSRDRERCDGNGELVRALNALPQRMADLEELATTRGMDDEVQQAVASGKE